MLRFLIRHWPALLILGLAFLREARREQTSVVALFCLGAAAVGMALNLVVNLANGGMPAATTEDSIPDEWREHYRPINDRTRLWFLSDWIPVGNHLLSPGDFLLCIGALGFVVHAIWKASV